MTRFTERVERDLGQIADRATPSSTAWEAIQLRPGAAVANGCVVASGLLWPDGASGVDWLLLSVLV